MKRSIQHYINLQMTPERAERELPGKYYEAFMRVWDWSAPRHGGNIGRKHDAFWTKYGKEAYFRRINKVRAAFGLPLIDPRIPGIDK